MGLGPPPRPQHLDALKAAAWLPAGYSLVACNSKRLTCTSYKYLTGVVTATLNPERVADVTKNTGSMYLTAGTDQACDPKDVTYMTMFLADSKEVNALLKLSAGDSSSTYTALEPYMAMSQWQTQRVLGVSTTCAKEVHMQT